MDNILFFVVVLLVAELFEALFLRSETLLGVLGKLYTFYKKSIFMFFVVQPGFYVLLYIILDTGILNFTMIFILCIKVFDIFYKIELIKQVFIKREVSHEIAQVLEWKMPTYFWLMGVFTYIPLLFYALS